jgi:hypothetical protein
MPPPSLETLRTEMPEMLPEAVRQDQRSPDFEISSWTVSRLSDQGVINPDGLFHFQGEGHDERGLRNWSVVLKVVFKPDPDLDISHMWNWYRELFAMQSGLLAELPPASVVAPRCYGVEQHEDRGWIWMEYIADGTRERWSPDEYAAVARQLGRFNGSYLNDASLPDFPWLARNIVRGWSENCPPFDVLDNPYVARHFSTVMREKVMRLWDEREDFYNALDRVPQTFIHADTQRRNLFLRKRPNGTEEVVVIDWAVCGIGPLGGEIYGLAGGSTFMCELDLADLPRVEAAVFNAYLSGLRDVGWNGDPDWVRLGYCAWFSMWAGATLPTLIAVWTSDQNIADIPKVYHREPEHLAIEWTALCEYALDRADEARQLMTRLL